MDGSKDQNLDQAGIISASSDKLSSFRNTLYRFLFSKKKLRRRINISDLSNGSSFMAEGPAEEPDLLPGWTLIHLLTHPQRNMEMFLKRSFLV